MVFFDNKSIRFPSLKDFFLPSNHFYFWIKISRFWSYPLLKIKDPDRICNPFMGWDKVSKLLIKVRHKESLPIISLKDFVALNPILFLT